MNLTKIFATNNACFKAGVQLYPTGLMLHSTGANNPNLQRYVQPDDGLMGNNPYGTHFNVPYPGGREVCVHGFIGKLADGSVATRQILPWGMQAWHAGGGDKGSANHTHIGVELCEDDLTDPVYFAAVYREAVELFAHLCRKYSLPPSSIISHKEGHAMGIAANHGDPEHWFARHGKTMDDFRRDVAEELEETMSYEKFKEYMERYLAQRDEREPDAYAEDACRKAIASGLFKDGDGDEMLDYPQAFIKRQDLALILDRLGALDNKTD